MRWNLDEITKQREEYHHQLLYLGHHSGVKPELATWENLKFYQQISQSQQGTDILWDVLETVGLLGREDLPPPNFQPSAKAHCLGKIMDL